MGAGTGPLAPGQVFRIVITFTDSAGAPAPIGVNDPTYTSFADAVQWLVRPGQWQADTPNPANQATGGGTILLRGPIHVNDAPGMNLALNRVMRGLRVKPGGASTGHAVQVVSNIGPAAEGSANKGPVRGPDTSDVA